MSDAEWIEALTEVALKAIWVGAIAYTAFLLTYVWWARSVWWRVPAGGALVVSSLASTLLLTLSLVFRYVEVDPLTAAIITVIVVGLVALGGILKLGAIVWEMWHHRPSVPPTP